MPKVRRMWTSFSKGEISPKTEGRPDLAGYSEGLHTAENFLLLRQGGMTRRPGLRFAYEVKDSTKDTILLPFEFSVDDAFVIETGDLYHRFYKNRQVIRPSAGAPPVEVATPYTAAELRSIHFTQSADVLFMFHPDLNQRRLSRVSDTDWDSSPIIYAPGPSFEADTDVSAGGTLTPSAVTGTGVVFTASVAVFLEADVNRQIIFGASRAIITGFGASAGDVVSPNSHVRATILDDFPDLTPIPTGKWLLRLSPQTTMDPDAKQPKGGSVNLFVGKNAFRPADVGKFIVIYGGVIEITAVTSPILLVGEIKSVLSATTLDNPNPAPAGAWTLEEASWSPAHGFPRTGEFFQGRLGQAATYDQPTDWWLSASDSFDDYAIGQRADAAVNFTIASRKVNRIEWLADEVALFIGTAGAEFKAEGGSTGQPIGGDVIPLVSRETSQGSSPVQPLAVEPRLLYLDRTRKKIFTMQFDLQLYRDIAVEVTAIAEHITGSGIRLGPLAFATRPDPRAYFVREDGTLVTLTYFFTEKVVGFTRVVTDGDFEAVAVIPQTGGAPDQVWVIVRRTVGGQDRRFVEFFDDAVPEQMADTSKWGWNSLQTDSAVVYAGAPATVITGLSHLEGKTVDVVTDGAFRGTAVVRFGQLTPDDLAALGNPFTKAEVGIHYDSTLVTMRPAVEGQVIEGLVRGWDSIWLRMLDSIGGRVNGENVQYAPSEMDTLGLYTGDKKVLAQGWDTEGRVTVEQKEPYPLTVLALFGSLSLADHD